MALYEWVVSVKNALEKHSEQSGQWSMPSVSPLYRPEYIHKL